MPAEFPLELLSNVVSICLCVAIVFKYIQHKKKLDVLAKLEELKTSNQLSTEDIDYIYRNEKEYRQKFLKAEGNIKIMNPVFILITGIIFIYLPLSEALIQLNVVAVVFIFIQLDKTNKKTIFTLLTNIKKDTKKED